MGGESKPLTGPDLEAGTPEADILEGKPLLGHALGEAVLVARVGSDLFAVAATCPHYGAPLGDGLQVGSSVRCPWHHATFDLATGAPTAPAINALGCYEVARQDGRIRVVGKRRAPEPAPHPGPRSVVIVGGGAAGHAAAETLRRQGYQGPITVISADPSEPYDRPNLSKDYLAGTAPEEWIPLRAPEDYAARRIQFRVGTRATAIDAARRLVLLSDGSSVPYDALLLATGATPIRLDVPGADAPHVHTLRSLADARAIIERAKSARKIVVVGASFIGLEAASSFRARGLEVDVVGLESTPLERVFGAEVGAFLRRVHEENGVRFHLQQGVREIDREKGVLLTGGERLPADLVVVGIGVRPDLSLAESAGAELDRGVKTDAYLQTSVPGIWAAGDIARWPDPRARQPIRVEHWAVAQRQGHAAALNILGERRAFTAVPFFWTVQHGVTLNYVGYADRWDRVDVDGSLEARDATVRYLLDGRVVAALTIGRDAESLRIEAELERARA